MNLKKGILKTLLTPVLAVGLLGCELTENPFESKATKSGTLAAFEINAGESVTDDPKLKLSLKASGTVKKMKISTNADCNGGEWQDYNPDLLMMSPKVNETVTLSVQYMDGDDLVSDCRYDDIVHDNPNTPEACETNPEVCDREPEVSTPGVVTVLLALGDQLNQQLVVNGSSAQVIAETAIKFASPVGEPRILVVRDLNNQGESIQDTEYVALELLKMYESVTLIDEPVAGLMASDLESYDLVWFNNPGYPMGSQVSRDTLIGFAGGVVLSGDDMTWGNGFSMEALTGLRFLDNGTEVNCGGTMIPHNDNFGEQYRVSLDPAALPSYPEDILNFRYGNDIDNTTLITDTAQVIAWAQGGPLSCTSRRPVISRQKKF